MDLKDLKMPAPESEELDLGLEEMELPGESEDKEVQEMIAKLEELGYKVEKVEEASEEEDLDEMEMEEEI